MSALHYSDVLETDRFIIHRLCIGPLAVNTFVIICRETGESAVIDPGGEVDAIIDAAGESHIGHMLLTHAHIDHVYGAQELVTRLGSPVRVAYHPRESVVVDAMPAMCRMFGMEERAVPAMDIDLERTPEFGFGRAQVRSILTPGHTPGSVCYYLPEDGICFTGDLLFRNSVGRTDFEGGSGKDLRKSLDLMLELLPDGVTLLPGHGKFTTMGDERRRNFYLKVDRWR